MTTYDFTSQLEEIQHQKEFVQEIADKKFIDYFERSNGGETMKFTRSMINKNAGNVASYIKGTKNYQRFRDYTVFPNLKTLSPFRQYMKDNHPEKNPVKTIRKVKPKKTVKKIKSVVTKKQLTFKQFFKKFFPGCFLSESQNDDIHISEKFARMYYNNYLKSGMEYAKFDAEMSL